MCRSMNHILESRPGAIALDVGTGSGVFAVWAARRGCRVVAIDINPRAIQFAKRNASRNGVRVVDSSANLVDGSIFFDLRAFDETLVEGTSTRFDFIFLNPPYNPTAPGITAALHADAGPDGQASFREQIDLVPRILGEQGVCIGNQMGLVISSIAGYAEQTIQEIRQAFSARCRVRFTRMMEEGNDILVDDFLRQLYLPLVRDGRLPVTVVEHYIDTTARGNAKFALLYYEVSRSKSWESTYFSPGARPDSTWADRLWIHRCILQTASINGRVG